MIELTEIERKVLQEIMEEKSANDIALLYNMTLVEVDEIRKNIMRKAGVRSWVGLAKFGLNEFNINQ